MVMFYVSDCIADGNSKAMQTKQLMMNVQLVCVTLTTYLAKLINNSKLNII